MFGVCLGFFWGGGGGWGCFVYLFALIGGGESEGGWLGEWGKWSVWDNGGWEWKGGRGQGGCLCVCMCVCVCVHVLGIKRQRDIYM